MRSMTAIYAAAILIITLGSWYIYNQFSDLIRGPSLTLHSPPPAFTSKDQTVVIAGTTKNASFISIDDRPIFISEYGDFSERLLLMDGYNIIEVYIRDKFGREKQERLEVVHASPAEQHDQENKRGE